MQIWAVLALATGLFIGIGNCIKKFLMKNGINPYALIIMNALIYAIIAFVIYIYLINKEFGVENITNFKKVLFGDCKLSKIGIMTAVIISSILFMAATITFTHSINNCPNTGYAASFASSTSVLSVFLISILLLQGEFNFKSMIGVFLILSGVVLINVYS